MGGADKSALILKGSSFAARIAAEFASFPEKLWLGGPRMAAPEGFRWAPTSPAGIGPLGALCGALEASRRSLVFAAACDMPLLRAEAALLLQAHLEDADIALFETARGPEPLCALYRKSCLPVLRDQIAAGDYALRHLTERLTCVRLPAPHPEQLTNVNTPEEYRHLLERFSQEVSQKPYLLGHQPALGNPGGGKPARHIPQGLAKGSGR